MKNKQVFGFYNLSDKDPGASLEDSWYIPIEPIQGINFEKDSFFKKVLFSR